MAQLSFSSHLKTSLPSMRLRIGTIGSASARYYRLSLATADSKHFASIRVEGTNDPSSCVIYLPLLVFVIFPRPSFFVSLRRTSKLRIPLFFCCYSPAHPILVAIYQFISAEISHLSPIARDYIGAIVTRKKMQRAISAISLHLRWEISNVVSRDHFVRMDHALKIIDYADFVAFSDVAVSSLRLQL